MNSIKYVYALFVFILLSRFGYCQPIRLIGSMDTGTMHNIVGVTNSVLIMKGNSNTNFYSLANPARPRLSASADFSPDHSFIQGDRLFWSSNVPDWDNESYGQLMEIMDISDPYSPEYIGGHGDPLNRRIGHLAVAGHYVYSPGEGLTIYDITNLDTIRRLYAINYNRYEFCDIEAGDSILVMNNQVDRAPDQVLIYSLSDPEDPVEIVGISTGEIPKIKLEGRNLYIAFNDSLVLYDLIEPDNPFRIQAHYSGLYPYYINKIGDAIVLAGQRSLRILILNENGDLVRSSSLDFPRSLNDFDISGRYLFAHSALVDSLYIYDCAEALSVTLTDIQPPVSFTLNPPFHNPFNASTTITYALPTQSDVTLQVYNTRGQLVDVLQDRVMTAGRHSVVWYGSRFSAGVYFVRMVDQVRNLKEIQKVVLVK